MRSKKGEKKSEKDMRDKKTKKYSEKISELD